MNIRFWSNFGPEPSFHCVNVFGSKNKLNTPVVWLKIHLNTKLVQNLTFKMAKVGPEPNLGRMRMHMHIYTHIQMNML